jgi:hypothetical protein
LVVFSNAAVIFPASSPWAYFKGHSEASSPDSAAWRMVGFNDSGWEVGDAPFYYENQPASTTAYTGNTLLNDMVGGYTCVFLRKTFVLANVADVSQLQFYAFSDDGFIAWINGVEVARFNMPTGGIPFDGASSAALQEPVPPQNVSLNDPGVYLVAGTNVIAVQAFNSSLSGSSDFVIDASLSYTSDLTPPVVTTLIPAAGATVRALTSLEVGFSEAVAGVGASDLLINGKPATNVTSFAPWQYVFDFPQPATGTVQIAWAANHGIHDLAGLPNYFAGGSWTCILDPKAPLPGVEISEFMADNKNVHDEDGDSSDWIELFNPTGAAVNLGGWALTDDPKNLREWRFPNVTLVANSYLLVFASGKNRTNATGRLHTSFQLSAGGEFLALVDPLTNIISSFTPNYPSQQTDVSYGRDRVSPEIVGYFTTPTPGAPNSTVGAGFSPPVEFLENSGTFRTPFSLGLYTSSDNAAIRYTLDGSAPGDTSLLYTSPISITNTVQVRARSFAGGLLPGPLQSETYVRLDPTAASFTSDLPVIIIHNFGAGTVPVSALQTVNLSFFEPQNGKSALTNAPNLSARAGIRVRGSSTQGLAKQSWAVEFRDEYDNDKNQSPLGLPEDSDWVLYAPNNFEPVLLHNPLILQLSNEIGRYAPRTRFVEVYLNTTGGSVSSANYNGIYVLEEKIKSGKDRVDIDKLQPENVNLPDVTGGYLMKIDRLDPGDSGFYAAGMGIAYVEPKESEIKTLQRTPQKQYLQNYMDAFGAALNGANFANPTNGYAAYVDVDAWIDHHILNVMAFNIDALRLSAYFYKERSGKLFFGPLWDFDRSQGSTDGRDFNPLIWRSPLPDYGTDFFNFPWWGRMFGDIDFWQRWIDRYQDLRAGLCSTNHIFADIDALANQVRRAEPREALRWSSLSTRPRSGTVTISGYSYAFPGTYQGEVDFLKQWYKDRLNFMDGNFLARPVFSGNGGPITAGFPLAISAPAGATLYYTTNGLDPRLPGGGIAPAARVYSSPIALNANARVAARAYDPNHYNLTGPDNPPLSSPWSGLTAATYVVATPPLVVTEIMYHPAPAPEGSTNTVEDFEYLELKNIGASALNLIGVRFTNGVDYTFTTGSGVTNLAAGERVLVVKNRAAFSSRYPTVTNIAGQYLGNLDNSGERLSLVGSLLEPILDFRYENWFPVSDGFGFSLVIVDENAPRDTWSQQVSWRPGSHVNGSPGIADPAPETLPNVLINEALTHTDPPQVDAVELYNPGTNSANIGGWFLTDDFNNPKKYRFPNTASIPARAYRVVDESVFNNGLPTGFSLSSLGDAVFLFSGDEATNLTGYFHGFDFGAAQNGVSFGRYVTSVGDERFAAQTANTLGQPNAGPRVGPVVINEIMYDPRAVVGTNNNTLDEYIELHNVTGQLAPLYDPNFPTNTWRLDGGVGCAFPMNLMLPPDGYLLVVNFDPVHQTNQLAAFRAKYAVAAGTAIVGPYSGTLENQGERINLLKPDPPQTASSPNPGFVPYVLVDQVTYSNVPPWPTNANATGLSLQRMDGLSYGDDPINWRAALPTAAGANIGAGPLDMDGDGLPDAWELAHNLDPRDATGDNGALGDPDGDGMSNWKEYLSGTGPRDASSYLRIEAVDAVEGAVRIHFMAMAGRTYTVLYCESIESGTWVKLADVPAQSSTGEIELPDSEAGVAATRFYRLATP